MARINIKVVPQEIISMAMLLGQVNTKTTYRDRKTDLQFLASLEALESIKTHFSKLIKKLTDKDVTLSFTFSMLWALRGLLSWLKEKESECKLTDLDRQSLFNVLAKIEKLTSKIVK